MPLVLAISHRRIWKKLWSNAFRTWPPCSSNVSKFDFIVTGIDSDIDVRSINELIDRLNRRKNKENKDERGRGSTLLTNGRQKEQLFYFRYDKWCAQCIFVRDGRFNGRLFAAGWKKKRKKKYRKEEEESRQEENQSFVPRPYRARNDRLFLLSLPSSSSSLHA